MDDSVLETISDNLLSLFPLFQKKLIGPIPAEQLDHHLPPSALQILYVLHESRVSTISAVCAQLSISRPNMTPLLDRLVKANLIERQPNREDRRVLDLRITPEGDRVIHRILQFMSDRIKIQLGTSSAEDLQTLADALHRIRTILSKLQTAEGSGQSD